MNKIIPYKFSIFYTDFPWFYHDARNLTPNSMVTKGHEKVYKYLSNTDLMNLPLENIAEDNSLMFMWTTGPKLYESIQIGETLGWQYITMGFTWEKGITNPGSYTLSSTEFVLILKRGKIPMPRGARNVRQFLSERRTTHSKKPDEIRDRIDLMFPEQNKIELFARNKPKVEGKWVNVGNEVDGQDIRDVLKQIEEGTYV